MTSNSQNAKNRSFAKAFFRWAVVVLFLCGIPVFMVSIAVYKYYSVFEYERINRLKSDLPVIESEIEAQVSQEDFIAQLFFDEFSRMNAEGAPAEAVIERLNELRALFSGEFEYIAWNQSGEQIAKTFSDKFSVGDWKHVFRMLKDFFIHGKKHICEKDTLEKARSILGRQLSIELLSPDRTVSKPILIRSDSALKAQPFCFYNTRGGIFFISFDPKKLKGQSGIRHKLLEASKRHKEFKLGLYLASDAEKPPYIAFKGPCDAELKKALSLCEKDNLSLYGLKNYYLAYRYLTENLRLFALFKRARTFNEIMLKAALGGLSCFILMLPFNIYLIKKIILKQPVAVSIKTKLSFLFIFACGIPITATAMILHEYGVQKRQLMMKSARRSCEVFLESFDKGHMSFLNDLARKLTRYFADWNQESGAKMPHSKALATLKVLDDFGTSNYSIIPLSEKWGLFPFGHMYFKNDLANAKINFDKSYFVNRFVDHMEKDSLSGYLAGQMLLSELNNIELDLTLSSKIDILVESLLRRSTTEFFNTVLNSVDVINRWQLSSAISSDYSYVRFLRDKIKNHVEYFICIFWGARQLQRPYAEKAVVEANRNSSRIKIFCRDEKNGDEFPKIEENEAELKKFSRRTSAAQSDDIEIVKYKGEDYIGISALGKNLYSYKITCLYPLKTIDNEITGRQTELISVMLFCLLFSVSLANLLARAFLIPMQKLLNGALAIERRDVAHRVNYKANDEFGQTASTFNNVMISLEELQTAQIVQESLFPKPSFKKGRFEIYGRSIAMSELGGDYFDYFETDPNHFAVLLGDVAGHGIAAAVVMAMAKAGILASDNLQNEPAVLLKSLHNMILGAKGKKQKKIMTFQYLHINAQSAAAVYSNAGACPLAIIKNSGKTIEEVMLKSSVLGGFKRAVFCDTRLKLNDFDAVVFYTDGIIEARNKDGKEIGYDGFKQMLLKNYSSSPEKFYNGVYADYKKHTYGVGAQDDLTMVFMICLPQNDKC